MSKFFRQIKWEILRRRVFERDRYTCQYCGSNKDLAVDHLWPRSKGGKDEMSNLVTACKSCNSSKNGKTLREWVESKTGPVIQVPAPIPPPPVVQIRFVVNQKSEGEKETTREFELPFQDRFSRFAEGVMAGAPISHTAWTGSGKLFSRGEFEQLQAAMLDAKLIQWKNTNSKNSGVELTPDGLAVFGGICAKVASENPTQAYAVT